MKSRELLDPKTAVAFDEYEEEPEPPSTLPALKRKFEKQNAPPPGAHNCYVGCPCVDFTFSAPPDERTRLRLKHQEKLARRGVRHSGKKNRPAAEIKISVPGMLGPVTLKEEEK